MKPKKLISLIAGICGIVLGLMLVIAAITETEVPKPLLLAFSVFCLINAVMILKNTKKNR